MAIALTVTDALSTGAELIGRVLQPGLCLMRRKRVGLYGIDAVPSAHVTPRLRCEKPECWTQIAFNARSCRQFARKDDMANLFAPRAAVVDLQAHADFADYQRKVGNQSGGNDLRSVKKARRLGYVSRPVQPGAYQGSFHRIRRSKAVRSRGLVLDVWLPQPPIPPDVKTPFTTPPCSEHWRIDYAVFDKTDEVAAYAVLIRSGDLLVMEQLIGHGDRLRDGVVKLLAFDILQWLFRRDEPLVAGLRYVLYGGVEDGTDGLANWRRYMQFKPTFLDFEPPPAFKLPSDFRPRRYLRLHPDVAAARVDPTHHYVAHGRWEGRPYK